MSIWNDFTNAMKVQCGFAPVPPRAYNGMDIAMSCVVGFGLPIAVGCGMSSSHIFNSHINSFYELFPPLLSISSLGTAGMFAAIGTIAHAQEAGSPHFYRHHSGSLFINRTRNFLLAASIISAFGSLAIETHQSPAPVRLDAPKACVSISCVDNHMPK